MCEVEKSHSSLFHSSEMLIGPTSKSFGLTNQRDEFKCNKKIESSRLRLVCHEKKNPKMEKPNKLLNAEGKSSKNRLPSHLEESILGSAVKTIHSHCYNQENSTGKLYNKGVQTDYRESECQTLPWEPPYVVKPGDNPEVLTLTNFKWGNGLPAGAHEIEIINRMRKERAWEEILPPMDTPANIKLRSAMITALQADKWAFRDSEIQSVMNLRMELMNKVMEVDENEKTMKFDKRCKRLNSKLNQRSQIELMNIRNRFAREMRKLGQKHRSLESARITKDVVRLNIENDGNYHDLKPRYDCSKIIQKHISKEERLHELEKGEKLPVWLLSARKPHYTIAKSAKEMCPRRAKRNARIFAILCKNVENIGRDIELSKHCSLVTRKTKTPPLTPAPSLASISDNRSYSSLTIDDEITTSEFSYDLDQESQTNLSEEQCEINEILEALEGKTIAKILTFLTNELTRLEAIDETNNPLSTLTECEEINRISSGGYKITEFNENQRRELNKMFRRILKANRNSVDKYLNEIEVGGIECISEKEVAKFIADFTNKIQVIPDHDEDKIEKITEHESTFSSTGENFPAQDENKPYKSYEEQQDFICATHANIAESILSVNDLLSDESNTNWMSEKYGIESKFDNITELTLFYAQVPEDDKNEVREILDQKLRDTEETDI